MRIVTPLMLTQNDTRSVFGGLLKIGWFSAFGASDALSRSNELIQETTALKCSVLRNWTWRKDFCRRIPSTKPKVVHTCTFSLCRPSEENQRAEAGAPSSPKTSLLLNCRYSSGNTMANSVEQNMDGLQQQRLEFNAYHDFLASKEEENTRCKHSSIAPPSLALPILSKILSQTSTIYFQMWRHIAKTVPYKEKSNYFHC